MPLPLLIGLAVVTGGVGIAKGIGAADTQSKANDINEKAQDIVDLAKEKMEFSRESSGASIKQLGECKVDILQGAVIKFINEFKKVKNIELDNKNIEFDEFSKIILNEKQLEELKDVTLIASSIAKGVAGGGVAGAVTAFGAYSMATTLATASTGTAIAGLSGAAATNATLAFFGGGSLAAGGLGMAGGAAVLGGLVAGPALAVLGLVASSKANANYEDAKSNLAKAKAFKSEISAAIVESTGIRRCASMFYRFLVSLNTVFEPLVYEMSTIINTKGDDFSLYSNEDKEVFAKAISMAGALKAVLDLPIIGDDGKLANDSILKLQAVSNKIKIS